ncbi:MAG: hypothetical protein IPK16_27250 [Anaerolineales bacterium]|nr:hypothetical protein [Anaerolineales bacterium]
MTNIPATLFGAPDALRTVVDQVERRVGVDDTVVWGGRGKGGRRVD